MTETHTIEKPKRKRAPRKDKQAVTQFGGNAEFAAKSEASTAKEADKEGGHETPGLQAVEPNAALPPEEGPPVGEVSEDAPPTDHTAPEDREARAPEGDETEPRDEPLPLTLAEGWEPMDTAPKGGKPCYLAGVVAPGVPLVVGAYLHHSRRYMGSAMRYVPYEEWRMIDTPFKVPFDPLCWTRYQ